MELTTFQLEKLTELLKVPEPEVLQGEDLPATNYEINATRHNKASANLDATRAPKTIEEFEQQEAEEAESMGKVGFGAGARKVPAYTMNYQQSVSAEDVFLQSVIGHVTSKPLTASYNIIYDLCGHRPMIYARVTAIGIPGRIGYVIALVPTSYLNKIGPKTPSSASCENLIVKVKMPGDKKENVDLSVEISSVTINSSQYYLKLALPHEINPDNSKANWNSDDETLLLTLKLNREFDFVNF